MVQVSRMYEGEATRGGGRGDGETDLTASCLLDDVGLQGRSASDAQTWLQDFSPR